MSRSRTIWLGLITSALLFFYVVGLIARQHYGILVRLQNESAEPLRELSLTVTGSPSTYVVANLEPGEHTRAFVFVQPKAESQIIFKFTDSSNNPHSETVVGYVEGGYCGKAIATVLPGSRIESHEDIDVAVCWRSWFDFY